MPEPESVALGEAPFKRFLDVLRPVRVWYNAEFTHGDGTPFWADTVNEDGSTKRIYTRPRHLGGLMHYPDVREINTAIIILDANMLHDITVGRLADYIVDKAGTRSSQQLSRRVFQQRATTFRDSMSDLDRNRQDIHKGGSAIEAVLPLVVT